MAPQRKNKGYGCLIASCVGIFLLMLLPPLFPSVRNSFNLGERAFAGLFLVVPLYLWLWWTDGHTKSIDEDDTDETESKDIAGKRRRFRFNIRTVWAITAMLIVASVFCLRWFAGNASEDARQAALREKISQRTEQERIAIISEYMNACEKSGRELPASPTQADFEQHSQAISENFRRIAESHRLTVDELNGFIYLLTSKPSSFVQRNSFELFVFYFTPLVILNTPLYWMLAALFFGSWEAYNAESEEYYSVPHADRVVFLRMNLHRVLCAAIILPEFWLLAQCMPR